MTPRTKTLLRNDSLDYLFNHFYEDKFAHGYIEVSQYITNLLNLCDTDAECYNALPEVLSLLYYININKWVMFDTEIHEEFLVKIRIFKEENKELTDRVNELILTHTLFN